MEGFGAGLGVGISVGIGIGIGSGMASARKKIQKQLRKAIDDNEVSIYNKNGEPLTIETFFARLNKNYKKV